MKSLTEKFAKINTCVINKFVKMFRIAMTLFVLMRLYVMMQYVHLN